MYLYNIICWNPVVFHVIQTAPAYHSSYKYVVLKACVTTFPDKLYASYNFCSLTIQTTRLTCLTWNAEERKTRCTLSPRNWTVVVHMPSLAASLFFLRFFFFFSKLLFTFFKIRFSFHLPRTCWTLIKHISTLHLIFTINLSLTVSDWRRNEYSTMDTDYYYVNIRNWSATFSVFGHPLHTNKRVDY